MGILSHCYGTQVEIWIDGIQLSCAWDQLYGFDKKINNLLDMASQILIFC